VMESVVAADTSRPASASVATSAIPDSASVPTPPTSPTRAARRFTTKL
jgi:hypothetical protein